MSIKPMEFFELLVLGLEKIFSINEFKNILF